ncbi:hypothetical protein VNO78_22128 [Psophocarpus tetragonolobus]|uniref:Uncharacterized protein n=1 Tax=Psophocarpus tetragonolobus TaxID=3891 RepID=A0AAN9SD25_PSOTE
MKRAAEDTDMILLAFDAYEIELIYGDIPKLSSSPLSSPMTRPSLRTTRASSPTQLLQQLHSPHQKALPTHST